MTPPASAAMPVGCTRCCWSSLPRFPTARFWTWAAARESCCGRWGSRFPETARTGLDLSANMLAVAREKLGGAVELVQGDAERLPFADGRFEVLLCNDSFHHYPNPGAAAAEFARVLQPGGVLLLETGTAPAGLRGVANLFLPLSGEGDVRLYSGAGAGRPAGTPLPWRGVPAGGALQPAGLGGSIK